MSLTHHYTDFRRVFDLLDYQLNKYPQKASLNSFIDGAWKNYSTEEVKKKADDLACRLIAGGYKPGDVVAVIPKMGSPEWLIIDFACQQAGLIIVPVHPTSTPAETGFILNETEAKICITADPALSDKVMSLRTSVPSLLAVYDLTKGVENLFGTVAPTELHQQLGLRRDTITENHTLAIVYTSGSSGIPKGTVLTHRNVVSNIKSIMPVLPVEPGDRALSFLPFSHIFERTACFSYMAFGVNIYFSSSRESLAADFKTVKPAFCTSVPKTLEKMYDYLLEQRASKNIVKKKIISWAMQVGLRFKNDTRHGLFYYIKLFFARVLVLNFWRNALGGKARFVIVGAAALRPDIARLFSSTGVQVLSGYGMTEASPFISVNRPQPGLNRFGTVGIPLPGIDVKLDEPNETGEGEIMVRGPNVTQGYYKRPELTQQVLTDGWLRTGDVGKFVDRKFLAITGRKKDIFKTTAGIYISPQELENHFTSSAFILQCLITGFNRPFISAILVPNFRLLQLWCEETGVHWTAPKFMIHNIKVIQKIQDEVNQLNEALENYKQIKKFILSDEEWTIESGELTTSFKVIRSRLMDKHGADIEKLYAD